MEKVNELKNKYIQRELLIIVKSKHMNNYYKNTELFNQPCKFYKLYKEYDNLSELGMTEIDKINFLEFNVEYKCIRPY